MKVDFNKLFTSLGLVSAMLAYLFMDTQTATYFLLYAIFFKIK